MSVAYLDLADFLATSELVLGNPAEGIARASRLELAESALHAPAASFGGIEFYPDLAIKAAVLCTRLVKNHPLPGSRRRGRHRCSRWLDQGPNCTLSCTEHQIDISTRSRTRTCRG
ncbi:MAG: hypothetical protein ACXWH0_03215, partial [Acidimicrobiia bacterium]